MKNVNKLVMGGDIKRKACRVGFANDMLLDIHVFDSFDKIRGFNEAKNTLIINE